LGIGRSIDAGGSNILPIIWLHCYKNLEILVNCKLDDIYYKNIVTLLQFLGENMAVLKDVTLNLILFHLPQVKIGKNVVIAKRISPPNEIICDANWRKLQIISP